LIKPKSRHIEHELQTYITQQEQLALESENKENEKVNMYQTLHQLNMFNPKSRYLKAPSNDFLGMLHPSYKPQVIQPAIGFDHQAKKFPRYKNVKDLWHFDF